MRSISIIGRIGKDAEIKTASNGKEFLKVSLCVNEGKGDEQLSIWYDCISSNMVLAKWLTKGSVFHVSGKPVERLYEGKIQLGIQNAQFNFIPQSKKEDGKPTGTAINKDLDDDLPF
jgi:single-stranded DNA-binding protein